jgi:hypothetical protein
MPATLFGVDAARVTATRFRCAPFSGAETAGQATTLVQQMVPTVTIVVRAELLGSLGYAVCVGRVAVGSRRTNALPDPALRQRRSHPRLRFGQRRDSSAAGDLSHPPTGAASGAAGQACLSAESGVSGTFDRGGTTTAERKQREARVLYGASSSCPSAGAYLVEWKGSSWKKCMRELSWKGVGVKAAKKMASPITARAMRRRLSSGAIETLG